MILSVARSVQQDIELELPHHWRELPPAPVLGSHDWIFEIVEETAWPAQQREALAVSIEECAQFALAHVEQDRSWIAIIDPRVGLVRAIASIVTIELTDERVADLVGFTTPDMPLLGAHLWSTQRSQERLAGHPSTVVHDIAAYNFDEGGPVIAERYVGTVVPDTGTTAVQLEILAEDLSSFDDIVATGNGVLDGLRLVDAA
jgi:hypothetical protein